MKNCMFHRQKMGLEYGEKTVWEYVRVWDEENRKTKSMCLLEETAFQSLG